MGRSLDQFDDVGASMTSTDYGVGYRPGAKGTRWTLAALKTWLASALTDTFAVLAHTHTADAITDATTAGKAVVRAADATAQRTALGLGNSATRAVGTTAGTVAAGDDSRFPSAGADLALGGLTLPCASNGFTYRLSIVVPAGQTEPTIRLTKV